MDMKSAVPAIGFALLLSTGLAAADDKTIAAKSGESVDIRPVYGALRCRSILVAPPEVEVLQAPPELKLSIREDMVTPLNCQDQGEGRICGGHRRRGESNRPRESLPFA